MATIQSEAAWRPLRLPTSENSAFLTSTRDKHASMPGHTIDNGGVNATSSHTTTSLTPLKMENRYVLKSHFFRESTRFFDFDSSPLCFPVTSSNILRQFLSIRSRKSSLGSMNSEKKEKYAEIPISLNTGAYFRYDLRAASSIDRSGCRNQLRSGMFRCIGAIWLEFSREFSQNGRPS